MAYRRSIIARSKLFYQQQQRFSPSFSHISSSSSSDRRELPPPKTISPFLSYNAANSLLSGNVSVSRLLRSNTPAAAGYGLLFHRNFSNVVADKAVEAAPVMNEVALAAADSLAPVAAFQHLIGYVHCYTGLEWWASIAATTILIRFIMIPIQIDSVKHMPVYVMYIIIIKHARKLVKDAQEMMAIMAKQRAPDPKRDAELESSVWKSLVQYFLYLDIRSHLSARSVCSLPFITWRRRYPLLEQAECYGLQI